MFLFEITDGVTTIALNDCDGIGIEGNGYAPAVSKFEDGRYLDVTEPLTLRIKGTSGTDVLAKANALSDLLDQASQLRAGENVRPVIMRYQVTSTSTIWYVLILAGSLVLPGNFINQDGYKLMWPVSMNIERRGQWLSTDRSDLVTNGSFENWSGDPLAPNSWTTEQGTPAQITRNSDTDFVTQGTYSLKLDPDTSASQPVVEITQEIPSSVIPHGVEVLITADVYVTVGSPSGSVPFLAINVYGASAYSTNITDTGGEFIQASLTAVSGVYGSTPATDGIRINLLMLDVDDVVAYVDNIRVVAVGFPDASGDQVTADVDNGDVATLNFAAPVVTIPRPVNAVISSQLLGTNASEAYAIVSERRGNETVSIERLLATDFATPWGADFTSVADSAGTLPTHGTNVLRFTPSAPLIEEQNLITQLRRDATLSQGIPAVAVVLAKVRNNATVGGSSFVMRLQASRVDGVEWTKPVVVEPDTLTARPQVIMLGMVEGVPGTEIRLGLRATVHAAGTFDIDTIYVVYITRHTHLIRLDQGAGIKSGAAGNIYLLRLNHNMLTLPGPTITAINISHSGTWSGSPRAMYTRKNRVDVCTIATGREATANTWRMGDSGGALIEQSWLLSRLQGVLIPQ